MFDLSHLDGLTSKKLLVNFGSFITRLEFNELKGLKETFGFWNL